MTIRFPWDAILMLLLIFFLGSCAGYTVYPRDNLVKLKCEQSGTLEDLSLIHI